MKNLKDNKIYQFIYKNRKCIGHLAAFLLFVFIAFIANKIPANHFVGVGDFYQLLDPKDHLSRYSYLWFNQAGQGRFNTLYVAYPFYAILAFAQYFLHFTQSMVAGLYMFIILYFSFLNFYFGIKWLFPEINFKLRFTIGLLYALNNFTIAIFTYSWGFSHQFLIYIFIPLLIGLFFKIIYEKDTPKNYFLLAVILIMSFVSFNNIAYFVALAFLQLLILAIAVILGGVKLNLVLLRKVVFIILVYFATSLFYLLTPVFLSLKDEISQISNATAWGSGGLRGRLLATGSDFVNSFFLTLDQYRFPFKISKVSALLSFAYFGVLISLLYLLKFRLKSLVNGKMEIINKISMLLVTLLILLVLSVRASGAFTSFNLFFYQLPVFNLFRSSDKIFVLIPFIFFALLTGLLLILKIRNLYLAVGFLILFTIPYPFYNGGIVKILSKPDENGYRYVNAIPHEYYEAQGIINSDNKSTSVVSLPFSVVNSIDWANYYKWHYIGNDPLHLLYNKNYVSANTYDHPLQETKLSFKEYNESGVVDEQKFLDILKQSGTEYIMVHKDIEQKWIDQSKVIYKTIDQLGAKGIIVQKSDNDYFNLYSLRSDLVSPLLSTDYGSITYEKINPTKYRIKLKNITDGTKLTFLQSFNSQWALFSDNHLKSSNTCLSEYRYIGMPALECYNKAKFYEGEELSYLAAKPVFGETHKMSGTFANSWIINRSAAGKNIQMNPDGSYNIDLILYFKPQSYFYLGILLNGIIMLGAITFYLVFFFRRGRKS